MAARVSESQLRIFVALGCALAGIALFQTVGNANRGYIDTASLWWWWVYQWINPESETQHGWLILALSGWLLFRNAREQTAAAGERPWANALWPGGLALFAALGLHALGFAAQQARVSILALLLFAWGVLRLGGGARWGRAAVFPLGFLVFAIPFGALDSLGFWLRLWVVEASGALARWARIDVIQSGTLLLAPDGRYNYDVAAACSGIRSLMALAALSVLIGYLQFRSTWRRALVAASCLPLVYAGNVARISAIVFAAHLGGPAWGDRAHDVMGYGIFVIVLGGVLLVARALESFAPDNCHLLDDNVAGRVGAAAVDVGGATKTDADSVGATTGGGARTADREHEGGGGPRDERRASGGNSSARLAGGRGSRISREAVLLALVLAVAAGEGLFLNTLANLPARGGVGVTLEPDGRNPVELPGFLGRQWVGWPEQVTAIEREILPPDTGYSRMTYVSPGAGRRVFLSIVLSGRDRSSIHRPELCLTGQGWTILSRAERRFSYPGRPDASFPASVLRVQRHAPEARGAAEPRPELIAYWFINADQVVATHGRRLAVDAWNRVARARADRWAYILVQTDASDGEAAALARMQSVLAGALPVFQRPMPAEP